MKPDSRLHRHSIVAYAISGDCGVDCPGLSPGIARLAVLTSARQAFLIRSAVLLVAVGLYVAG